MVQIISVFLQRPIVSLHETSRIYPQESGVLILCCLICFFYSECAVAAELHFMNHHGPQFHLKLFFTVLLKKKHLYLDELTVSKLTGEMFIFV